MAIADSSKATVRVREQLVGVSAPSDAVLVAKGAKGSFTLRDDGTFGSDSVISFDLTTLTSDQRQRDETVKRDPLQVTRFSTAEFVPTKATGLTLPLAASGLGAGVTVPVAIVVEALLTLFLVWVVFGTAVSPLAPRIGGLGIGFAVAADIFVGGGITGAAMNPARWFGPAVAAGFYDNWFVYWIGPLVGAAVAGLSYRYVFAPPEGRAPAIVSAPPV